MQLTFPAKLKYNKLMDTDIFDTDVGHKVS